MLPRHGLKTVPYRDGLKTPAARSDDRALPGQRTLAILKTVSDGAESLREDLVMSTPSSPQSSIFSHLFSTPAMRHVFSDANRVQRYLDIEAALARVQARLGIVPQEAADEIAKHCRAEEFDFAGLKDATERIGYP